MRNNPELARKLKALDRKIAMIEHLKKFLKKNPRIARESNLWYLSNKASLMFPEKAFIRPVQDGTKIRLQLERYVDDILEEAGEVERRTVHRDLTNMRGVELDKVLRKVHVTLKDPGRR